jgi:membrane-associated phospholipid phosphatase
MTRRAEHTTATPAAGASASPSGPAAPPPPASPPALSAAKELSTRTGAGRYAGSRAPAWQPAHRIIAFWLLATAPLLAVPVQPLAPRMLLLATHLLGALLLLRQPLDPRALPGTPALWWRLRDWLPLLLVPMFYWEVPLLAEAIHRGAVYDALVMRWEDWMFRGQPSQTLAGLAPWLWISEPLHAAYLSYYFIVIAPPAALYLMGRRTAFRRVVFTMTVAILAHQAAFVAFPVLGPRYLFPAPAGPLEAGPLYQLTHWVLERGSSPGTAFPSSHVGMSVAMTLALFRERATLAPWVAALTTLLAIATVYGGFHYAVDAVAGVALGAAAALAAPGVRARMRRTGQRAGTLREGQGLRPE